mgnify:CR=1 FL=1
MYSFPTIIAIVHSGHIMYSVHHIIALVHSGHHDTNYKSIIFWNMFSVHHMVTIVHCGRHITNYRCVITWDMFSVHHMVTIVHCGPHDTNYRCVITWDIFCVHHMVTIVHRGCVWPGCQLTLQMSRLNVCLPVDASSVCSSTQGGAHHSYNTNKPLYINMSHQQCMQSYVWIVAKKERENYL